VVCAAEPVKPKLIETGTVVADESVAVTVSVPPSSGREGVANDKLTVGSPFKVAVTDDVVPMTPGALTLVIPTVMVWSAVLLVSTPVSVMLPVVLPAGTVIEMSDAV
jgi:hypothetical protein